MDLSPKFANEKIFEGEGGSYHSWSGEHGVAGMVLSNDKRHSKEEMVLGLRKGDIIPVPSGASSWWYNYGDSDFIIVFLGETSTAYVPGEFTYFLLTGDNGILGAFSPEFTSKADNMTEKEAKILAKTQTGVLIIKLGQDERNNIPLPEQDNVNLWVKNVTNFPVDICVEKAGIATSFTGENFPFLEQVGLSCRILKLDANAMLSPMYTADSTVQIFYVAKGSCKVQIVGLNAKLALDSKVEAGQLVIVPRYFVVAMIADGEGMECFSVVTSTEPAFTELASKQSVLNSFSPSVLQTALNVNPEFIMFFEGKMATSDILIHPD